MLHTHTHTYLNTISALLSSQIGRRDANSALSRVVAPPEPIYEVVEKNESNARYQ